MSYIPIKTEGLGKRYRIGTRTPYRTITNDISKILRFPIKSFSKTKRENTKKESGTNIIEDHVWAIKDINLEINQGDVVGLIGSNGSGKTTLLRVLSNITKPTQGFAEIRGRIGSLLEVGTGFHPELTGRENVYLQGSILGMRRTEIRSRYDDIVEFAGVSKFMDTPVKLYSSGMYLRLAFAVAAHLDTEVLLVDEVLAVGDAEFQNQCLGKMRELGGSGKTVLFVSHNMTAVSNLCNKGIFLKHGHVAKSGSTEEAIDSYMSSGSAHTSYDLSNAQNRFGTGMVQFTKFTILDDQNHEIRVAKSGDSISLRFDVKSKPGIDEHSDSVKNILCRIRIKNEFGQAVTTLDSYQVRSELSLDRGTGKWVCHIEQIPLMPGRYTLDLFCGILKSSSEITFDDIRDLISLEVLGGDFFGSQRIASKKGTGFFLIDQKWGNT